jgi:hypothetical protein
MAEEDDDIDCSSMADFLKSIESSDDEDDSMDKNRRQLRCNLPKPEATQTLGQIHPSQTEPERPAASVAQSIKPAAVPPRRMVANSYAQRQGQYREAVGQGEDDEPPPASHCKDDDDALNLAAIRAISKEERDPSELTSILNEVDAEYGKTLKPEMLAGGLDGCVIDQVLSPNECTALIDATERMGFTFWNMARCVAVISTSTCGYTWC